jgi:hypothetical protein
MPAYHVHRSIVINDTPANVFDQVADFGTWPTWSPRLCAEPDAQVTIPVVRALRVDHVGSYDNVGNAWNAADVSSVQEAETEQSRHN